MPMLVRQERRRQRSCRTGFFSPDTLSILRVFGGRWAIDWGARQPLRAYAGGLRQAVREPPQGHQFPQRLWPLSRRPPHLRHDGPAVRFGRASYPAFSSAVGRLEARVQPEVDVLLPSPRGMCRATQADKDREVLRWCGSGDRTRVRDHEAGRARPLSLLGAETSAGRPGGDNRLAARQVIYWWCRHARLV